MTLLTRLFLRFAIVATVCLMTATGYVMVEAVGAIRSDVRGVAEIAARQIEMDLVRSLSGYGSEGSFAAVDRLPVDALGASTCIQYASDRGAWTRCTGADGVDSPVPAWFAAMAAGVIADGGRVSRPVTWNGRQAGLLTVSAGTDASVARAWLRVSTVAGVVATVTGAMALLLFAAVTWSLRPLRRAVDGLQALGDGRFDRSLPRSRTAEFDALADAVEALAERLRSAEAERTALLRRLIDVQEEERRVLARDLHDEFGQCLTAIQSLSAGIAIDGAGSRTADDADLIGRLATRLADAVRGALARLRPPELDDYGLAESLRGLVRGRDSVLVRRDGTRIPVTMTVDRDLARLPPDIALALFRVAQECLTNVARHGRPQQVHVRATCEAAPGGGSLCRLEIEDDGGGGAADGPGRYGLAGARERMALLGGLFDVHHTGVGLLVRACVPVCAGASP